MTKIISEIGWNHMGDLELAKKIVDDDDEIDLRQHHLEEFCATYSNSILRRGGNL